MGIDYIKHKWGEWCFINFSNLLEPKEIDKKKKEVVKDTFRKIVCLFDIHFPYNIKLDNIIEYIKDEQPDKIILGGDILDLDGISHWNDNKKKSSEGKRFLKDIDPANMFLDKLQEVSPTSKIVWMMGNHEEWIEQHLEKYPYLDGVFELKHWLKLDERGIEIIAVNEMYKLSKHLGVIHGFYTNVHHAKKHAENCRTNIIYGHAHTYQTYTHFSPIDSTEFHAAFGIGCLCSRGFDYKKGRPDKWVNMFASVYIDTKTGYFNVYPVTIVKDSFIAPNNKVYK